MAQQLPKQINTQTFPVLTMQNKYVQSYFMKNDSTYKNRTDSEIEEKSFVLFSYNKLISDKKSVNHSFFLNLGTNTSKYNSLFSFINSFEKEFLNLEIQRHSNICFVFYDWMTRSEIISLIRSFLCDLQMKSVMLLPYSLGLSISNGFNNCIVLTLCDDGALFSFIDDNALVDKYRIPINKEVSSGFRITEEEDFAEEFAKKVEQKFICDICNLTGTYEKISDHYKSEHFSKETYDSESKHIIPIDSKEEDEEKKEVASKRKKANEEKRKRIKNSNEEIKNEEETKIKKKVFPSQESFFEIEEFDLENQIIYVLSKYVNIFKNDKNKKSINVILAFQNENKKYDSLVNMIYENVEGNVVIVDDWENKAVEGANMLSNIESSKELWIIEQEWNDFGIRVLKEKILFYI